MRIQCGTAKKVPSSNIYEAQYKIISLHKNFDLAFARAGGRFSSIFYLSLDIKRGDIINEQGERIA